MYEPAESLVMLVDRSDIEPPESSKHTTIPRTAQAALEKTVYASNQYIVQVAIASLNVVIAAWDFPMTGSCIGSGRFFSGRKADAF
jgi:hypothetical protein